MCPPSEQRYGLGIAASWLMNSWRDFPYIQSLQRGEIFIHCEQTHARHGTVWKALPACQLLRQSDGGAAKGEALGRSPAFTKPARLQTTK